MTIGKKLVVYGLLGSILPLLLFGGVSLWQQNQTLQIAEQQSRNLALSDLDHTLQGIHAMLMAQQELLEQKVAGDLNVAANVLQQLGGVQLSADSTDWSARNQYTGEELTLFLPRLQIGDQTLFPNADMQRPSPLVDQVKKLVGGTCTLFQRMNSQGDMLRVATNVAKKDGQRAIGTFIPATNPDGQPNPVLQKVLRGERFIGRAYVVNAWYITAYEPVRDGQGQIVGVLYVGIPQESAGSLRQQLMQIRIGQTGYVYVLDTKGRYVLSKDGARDGETILDTQDATGRPFIRELISRAQALKPGEIAEDRYAWQNPGEAGARTKITRLFYFAPWDWIVVAGTYEEELLAAVQEIQHTNQRGSAVMGGIFLLCLISCVGLWLLIARSLTRPLKQTVALLGTISQGTLTQDVPLALRNRHDEMGEMAQALQQMVENLRDLLGNLSASVTTLVGSSTQLTGVSTQTAQGVEALVERSQSVAAAAEEASSNTASVADGMNQTTHNLTSVASATEEMSATVGEIAANSEKARHISEQAMGQTQAVTQTMEGLGDAARQINMVTETITEISSQTNLLALNATIEAARAGAAGKGFAVVAGEIKELARQTAGATEDIKQRIAAIQQSTGSAIGDIDRISQVIRDVAGLVNNIAAAIEQQSVVTRDVAGNIAHASSEVQDANDRLSQTATVSQAIAADVSLVTTTVDDIRQGNLQVQHRSEELSQLASQLQELVNRFSI